MKEMRRILIIFTTLLLFSNCGKEREEIIPNVSFYVKVDLTDPKYSSENTFIVYSDIYGNRAGISGVVVYRLSSETFYAFDLMCPKEKQMGLSVNLLDDITCECPRCKSQFLIATPYGDVISGPAPWPLKSYKTSVSAGGTILNIWN